MINHAQCLPWCGHLIALQDQLVLKERAVEHQRSILAKLERDVADRKIQIRLMQAAGARS
jgi:hypothetical protein